MSDVISHLRRMVLLREGAGLTDGQLLEDYLCCREEAALEVLVRRHAPMVWGVCRRVLGNYHDAEDAFQATFLILVRKAASIASPKFLANWLYGVAHQTALKARATAAKRRARERQVTEMPEPAATEPDLWNDVQPLLDQELSRLPDKYRVAIVLCDLERKTRKEAARQLGVPEGTLAARVARARVMLVKRLARHGLAVSGGALAATLAQHAASAGVPTAVVSKAIKAASLYAAGQPAAVGLISGKTAALTERVLQTMLLSKLKVAVVVMLTLGALGIGATALPYRTVAAENPSPASKSAKAWQDDGNLKETVLALEKRVWEAHTKSSLVPYQDYFAKWRVTEYSIKDPTVILLNATSAIVTYEVRLKIGKVGDKNPASEVRHNSTAWAKRDGNWWCVFSETSLLEVNGIGWKANMADYSRDGSSWKVVVPLSLQLEKINADKKP
jgi:RNA polymerase sigma factor (sigma-70 family)